MNKTFNKKIIFSISLLIIIGIAGSAVIVNAQQESEYRKVAVTTDEEKRKKGKAEKEPGTSYTREETMTGTGKKKKKKTQKEKEAERRAQNTGQKKPSEFVPLETIPGVIERGNTDLNQFFNGLFKFGIIIAGFLAVVMIAVGGIQYMSTDAIHGKSEGRERITYALMGLLLILFSWILLNTVNPDILDFSNDALFK